MMPDWEIAYYGNAQWREEIAQKHLYFRVVPAIFQCTDDHTSDALHSARQP